MEVFKKNYSIVKKYPAYRDSKKDSRCASFALILNVLIQDSSTAHGDGLKAKEKTIMLKDFGESMTSFMTFQSS